MRNYYRIMLGQKSKYADECYKGNFIGANFGIAQDLTNELPDNWREFNLQFIPVWQQAHPGKSKVSAGLSCGYLWTITKGIKKNDIVLCPNGQGRYYVGEVTGSYSWNPKEILPHRRAVQWHPVTIDRSAMSDALKNSAGSIGTVSDISRYSAEIDSLIGGSKQTGTIVGDSIEDPNVFALEEHLEEFLIKNWKQTELGKYYDIYEEDGEQVGQQYRTDTGSIDILAISKDKKSLVVVELKRGRASDKVVGQIQRYMGDVLEVLAEKNQQVKGIIIALEDDLRIKRALSVTNNIEFYKYQVDFKLFKN